MSATQTHPPVIVTPSDQPRARRIEEAALNAWPAMQQVLLDGWLLRFTKGFTKRSNCIVPIYAGQTPVASDDAASSRLEKIRYCENLYAREQLQTVFRLTSIDHHQIELDQQLAERNYRLIETDLVMTSDCGHAAASTDAITWVGMDQWMQAYSGLTGMPEPAAALHRLILNGINGDCAFAVIYQDEQAICCGLAIVERELVGLFDIFTHSDFRGQGHAGELVLGLMDWGRTQAAQHAYLQVVHGNHSAAALYRKLGFIEDYRYWYRVAT